MGIMFIRDGNDGIDGLPLEVVRHGSPFRIAVIKGADLVIERIAESAKSPFERIRKPVESCM